jgi:hypothetical protein
MQAFRIAALSALVAVPGCATTTTTDEPIAWRLEREEHAARVRVFECREAVARGARSDCKPEIADLAKAEAARRSTAYSGVSNIGVVQIE